MSLFHQDLKGKAGELQVAQFEVPEQVDFLLDHVFAEILDIEELVQVSFPEVIAHILFINLVLVLLLDRVAHDVFVVVLIDEDFAVGSEPPWTILADRVHRHFMGIIFRWVYWSRIAL